MGKLEKVFERNKKRIKTGMIFKGKVVKGKVLVS